MFFSLSIYLSTHAPIFKALFEYQKTSGASKYI